MTIMIITYLWNYQHSSQNWYTWRHYDAFNICISFIFKQ